MSDMMEAAEKFAAALNEKFADKGDGTYTVDKGGRKYVRIVDNYGNGQRSVHAFVDLATGDLLKPAGWSGPAKGARGNLSTEAGFAAAVNRADPYGSYLYR